MKIAILGFAKEGRAAFEYWNRAENELTICDTNTKLEVPSGVNSQLGPDYLKNLDKFELLVRTPALHPKYILEANPQNPDILDKVTSVTNEFLKVCPTKNIIGVTGTKGKGTTSTLITKMLEADGKRVHLGGNIGVPALELLKNNIQPDDWVVLELSSFQLFDLKTSPHIAVCLMVASEHLDWHADIEEYMDAKQQLFMNQTEEDIAIYFADNENSEAIADASVGKLIPYFHEPGAVVRNGSIIIEEREICKTSDIKLLGKHNWQNICAAVTVVWQVTQNIEAVQSVIKNFSGLPFRIEFRREFNGIRFYDDSFASMPDSCLASIKSIPGPLVMIVGGYDRKLDLIGLSEGMLQNQDALRHVLLIGQSANRTSENFHKAGFTNFSTSNAKNMFEIVHEATSLAQPGDAVVLSPGFASFDMFKNFEERGVEFNKAVEAL